ncbi:MAG: PorT family protein [Bacteroidetes bacterium]|nr:PorT family protein [Bacteroidota bacterium]
MVTFNYKWILTCLICTVFLYPAFSQRFTGGISVGVVGSQVDGDTYSGYKKAGFTAGGWVNLAMSERTAFEVGLHYIQKGSRHNPDTLLSDLHVFLIKISYVEMPFLFQYKLNKKLFIEAGPSLGVMVSHQETLDYLNNERVPFRLLDFGSQIGLGYRINDALKVGLRLGNSVASIRKGEYLGYRRRFGNTFGQYNNVLALEIAYTL